MKLHHQQHPVFGVQRMTESPCPAISELEQLHQGTLPEDSVPDLIGHLDECESCQQTMEELTGSTVAGLARISPQQSFEYQQEWEFEQLEQQLLKHPPELEPNLPWEKLEEYSLIGAVGQGGMGLVYQARHTKLDRLVAIKVLPRELLHNSQAMARFEREMRAVGRLEHPHIVRALDAREIDGIHFLVMEFLEGSNCADLAKTHGPLPVADACEIIRQAALGLHHVHQCGLIHRDVKPSNLMISKRDSTPEVKLLDLGLALLSEPLSSFSGSNLTHSGQVMGTLDYMAPEQCEDSHTVTPQTDLYSLGATLYKLLAGESPFPFQEYGTFGKQFKAVVSETPLPVEQRRSGLPAELSQFIAKMIDRDPGHRPATALEISVVLESFCTGHQLQRLRQTQTGNTDTAPDLTATNREPAQSTSAATRPAESRSLSLPHSATDSARWSQFTRLRLLLVVAILVLTILAGVIVIIKTPDGREHKLELPDGTEIQIQTVPEAKKPADTRTTPIPTANHPTEANPDRKAAEWVLKTGGWVKVLHNQITQRFNPGQKLPEGKLYLREAHLDEVNVTDEDLKNLQGMRFLTRLTLRHTRVTGRGLMFLKDSPLEFLALPYPQMDRPITDQGLKQLSQFRQLTELVLSQQRITVATVRALRPLSSLRRLNLYGADTTEASLIELGHLTQLDFLDLGYAEFTPNVFKALQNLQTLKTLHTFLELEQALKFSKRLPNCRVHSDPPTDGPGKRAWVQNGKVLSQELPQKPTEKTAGTPKEQPSGNLTLDHRFLKWYRTEIRGEVVVELPSGERVKIHTESWDRIPNSDIKVVEVLIGPPPGNPVDDNDLRTMMNFGLEHLEAVFLNVPRTTSVATWDVITENYPNLKSITAPVDKSSFPSTNAIPYVLRLKKLEKIYLYRDFRPWAEAVSELHTIREIETYRSDMSAAGLKALAKLPNLKTLILRASWIYESELPALVQLKNLEHLSAYFHGVPSQTLMRLAEMKNLKALHFESPVTPEFIARLKAKMPNCKITGAGLPVN